MKALTKVFLFIALSLALPAFAAGTPATLYKNPNCGCCEEYAKYLRANSYSVKVIPSKDMSAIKRAHNVPPRLESCHTTLINGYVFEGHVPVESVNRVLKEHSMTRGLSLPGMPAGSPGMTGEKKAPFVIYRLESTANPRVYETR